MADNYSLDTSVFTRLTKDSEDARYYLQLIGDDPTTISFQVRAEALGAEFPPNRQQNLFALLKSAGILPHSPATDIHYARASRVRRELRRRRESGSDASDGDIWVIASTLEHDLVLLSHDNQQVAMGRAVGLEVLTNLPGWREGNPALR